MVVWADKHKNNSKWTLMADEIWYQPITMLASPNKWQQCR